MHYTYHPKFAASDTVGRIVGARDALAVVPRRGSAKAQGLASALDALLGAAEVIARDLSNEVEHGLLWETDEERAYRLSQEPVGQRVTVDGFTGTIESIEGDEVEIRLDADQGMVYRTRDELADQEALAEAVANSRQATGAFQPAGEPEGSSSDGASGLPPFPAPLYPVGTRVRLTAVRDVYPHFVVPKGATGTVTISEAGLFAVRMDEHVVGTEEWENEIHWYMQGEPGDSDDPRGYLEKIEPQADDFINHSRLEQLTEVELRTLVAEGGPSALIDAAQAEIGRRDEQADRRTLTAVFDVTGLTDRQIQNLAGEVEVQAERNKEPEPYDHPSVPVLTIQVDNPPLAEEAQVS